MKPSSLLLLIVVAALGGVGGWFAGTRSHRHGEPTATAGNSETAKGSRERKILFYQSAMHPWIKSDRPGKCTICGMELTPVFEGDTGFDAQPGMVTLSSNSMSILGVATTEVGSGPLTRTLRVAGTIDDDETRHRFLSAYVAGRIEELYVNFVGTEVRAGQPMARFYSPMLLEAERQFLALNEAHRLTQETPGAASLTNAFGDHILLRDSAAERLRQLGLTPEQIAALPGKSATNHLTEILAPVSGTVVNRFVYAGQNVMEGEKLFEIADFSTMWFRFDVYEQDLPWIHVGQEVEVSTPSLPGRSFKAPIRFIDPNLVDMTRSAKVRVELPNPPVPESAAGSSTNVQRLFRHRIYAEGRVRIENPNVLRVPRTAVLSPDGQPVVYVDHSGGAFERRPVRLGRLGDTEYEVLEGLKAGERVVISGNLLIDAQAQLNLAVHGGAQDAPADASPTKPTEALPPLNASQETAMAAFLAATDGLRTRLAGDDLAGFNNALPELIRIGDELTKTFAAVESAGWQTAIRSLTTAARLTSASDLRSARKAFHPLSSAAVAVVRQLRSLPDPKQFADLRIYQCPMTAEAFDGAPARAQWFQLAAPLRNPWFGSEMLECGVEVKP